MKSLALCAATAATLFAANAGAQTPDGLPGLNGQLLLKATEFVDAHDNSPQNLGNNQSITTSVDLGRHDWSSLSGTQASLAVQASNLEFVGWTEAGEWLEYHIWVEFPGEYTVNAFTSSPNSNPNRNGALNVWVAPLVYDSTQQDYVPDTSKAHSTNPVQLPRTNAWFDYRSTRVGTVPLQGGRYVVRVNLTERGLNLYGLGFAENHPDNLIAYEDFRNSVEFRQDSPPHWSGCTSWDVWPKASEDGTDDDLSNPLPQARSLHLVPSVGSMTGTFPDLGTEITTSQGLETVYPTNIELQVEYTKDLSNPNLDTSQLRLHYRIGPSPYSVEFTPSTSEPIVNTSGVIVGRRYVATASIPQALIDSGDPLEFNFGTYDPSSVDPNAHTIYRIKLTGDNPAPTTRLFRDIQPAPANLFFTAIPAGNSTYVADSAVVARGDAGGATNRCFALHGDPAVFDFEQGPNMVRITPSAPAAVPLLHTATSGGLQELVFITPIIP